MTLISFSPLQDGVTGVNAAATNTPLSTIYNDYNGNITDANISASAAIAQTKVSLLTAGAKTTSVATSETTTSTSYVGLTTPCAVTATIGSSGMALVITSHEGGNSGADALTLSSFALSGATTQAASDTNAFKSRLTTATATQRGSSAVLLTGLNAGSTTFTQQYRVTSGTGTFLNRNISVIPL